MAEDLNGRLLVASPNLNDGHFLRSVVLVVRHDEEGAFGLVTNRPTERRLRNLDLQTAEKLEIRDDDLLYRGGPVDGPLLALHSIPGIGAPCGPGDDQSSIHLQDNPAEAFGEMSLKFDPSPIWLTGDQEHVRVLARRRDATVRFFSGYSGWGPRQLDYELSVGGWLIADADVEIVFGDVDHSWDLAVKRCGRDVLGQIDPSISFGDPNLN